MRLPAERVVVVDAKVPMDAYLGALEAKDEGEQRRLLRRHGRQTRQHIDALASKAYHAQFAASPEFVVMFIPNEGVCAAALEAEPTLLEHGAAKGVLIATFLEPYAKLGRQLNSAVTAYNQGAGSLDARVLPQLPRLEEAGAASEKTVPELAGVDTPARLMVAPEAGEDPGAEAA